MTYSYSTSFTATDARYLASKVAADLYQCYLLYDKPNQPMIMKYETELAILLAGHYVGTYEFGFERGSQRVVSWFYTAGASGTLTGDSSAGQLRARLSITGASYFNFLSYSLSWAALSPGKRDEIQRSLPITRSEGEAPTDGSGSWTTERTYSSGVVQLERKVFKPW